MKIEDIQETADSMPIYKKVNKDFFKKWSHDMAYVLGFFAADGSMIKTKRGTHFIAIQVIDKEIVYAIRKVMDSEHTISKRERFGNESDAYRLQVGSKEMFEDLIQLGFVPGKTKRLAMPVIPKKYFGDFVRGYFDGDGNVWVGFKHKERSKALYTISTVFTSGTKEFLINFQLRLQELISTSGSLVEKKGLQCSSLQYSIGDTLKLYDFMYNRGTLTSKLFLNRKKVVFEKYIRGRSSTG